jgi:predicted nucleic acid-binding protein
VVLLDSSVWIEFLTGGSRFLGGTNLFETPSEIALSTVNIYEIGRYVLRTSGPETMEETLAGLSRCRIIPVSHEIARLAIQLASRHGLHTADALIAATARMAGVDLVTFDKELLLLDGAREP